MSYLLITKREDNFILKLWPFATTLNVIPLTFNLENIFYFFDFLFNFMHILVFKQNHQRDWPDTFRYLK